jgi:reactive intermediate/imine deaminase
MMLLQNIHTKAAPSPAGHYSQATRAGDLLFISAQLPIEPVSGTLLRGTFEEETLLVLANVGEIVAAAGGRLTDIAKVTLFIEDIGDWPKANAAYAAFFGGHRPARSVVPVGLMHLGARIVVEAVAHLPRPSAPSSP